MKKNLKVIPSFSIASIVNLDFIVSFAELSKVNIAGVRHGEQGLVFHNPIPVEGRLITEGKITDIYDKRDKGALIVVEFDTFHSNGKKLYTNIFSLFCRLDGGFGGPEGPKKQFYISRTGTRLYCGCAPFGKPAPVIPAQRRHFSTPC